MKRWLSSGALALVFAAVSCVAFAQSNSAATEVKTARAHALMAARANSLTKTHAHLQHVVNCLVGPNGTAFDAKAADPCKAMGAGALPDTSGDQALHGELQKALEAAQSGVKANSLSGAHKAANRAVKALTGATKAEGK